LGRHELPRRFIICATLPRNAAGKILKRELRRTGEVDRGVSATVDSVPSGLDPAG
jgi:long-chain acyl-CoA synthetase